MSAPATAAWAAKRALSASRGPETSVDRAQEWPHCAAAASGRRKRHFASRCADLP